MHTLFSKWSIFSVLTLLILALLFPIPNLPWITTGLRWIFIIVLAGFAWNQKKLTYWILLALVSGISTGLDFPQIAAPTKIFSDIFIRLIKTIIAPLVFSTLVIGIAGHSDIKKVGRLGLKSILYFEFATTLALVIGLIAINWTQAGKQNFNITADQSIVKKADAIMEQSGKHNFLLEIFPESIVRSMSENHILQVVSFSILFGIGLSLVSKQEPKKFMLEFCESLSSVMFKFTDIVMWFAPFAVFGAMAYSVSSVGIDVLQNLLKLVGTLYLGLIAFVLFVLLPIAYISKLPIKRFLNHIIEPLSIAFATASSESALPKAMENMEKMGIPRHIVSFVLPTGYSLNLDGTTLYLSMASVFVAQSCGIDLSLGQQISMCLILMVTSKGVAGVRGASFLILISTITSLGLDVQKAFPILAIDVLMDMARTSINVLGNCLASFVVAKWEKEI